MDKQTYGLMNDAVRSLDEMLELLANHPRIDIVQRAEWAKSACLSALTEAVQKRLAEHKDKAR